MSDNSNFLKVGDALNLMSAIFFGIHTLRTEHISRSTNQDKFLALLGYQVCFIIVVVHLMMLTSPPFAIYFYLYK